MKIFLFFTCLIFFGLINSCGIKGPLFLPEEDGTNELRTI
jgi:predicted small lipoprotein YifL